MPDHAPAVSPAGLPAAGLDLTGERTVPGIDRENYWFRRHEAAYAWAADRLPSGPVLDAGCGEGYGADLLARLLDAPVLALDYDAAACAHARQAYPRITVARANLGALPLREGGAGSVVSFQVLEHLWDAAGFLAQIRRTLRAGGVLVLSTPNRLTFSPGLQRGEKPPNPFHAQEFDAEQVQALILAAGFDQVEMAGLHHAPRLMQEERERGLLVEAQVHAITTGAWTTELEGRVAAVTTGDFTINDRTHDALDLLAVAVRT